MRQVGDTLVWFAVILVVVAVVYFSPRVANYVTAAEFAPGRAFDSRAVVHPQSDDVDEIP